MVRAFAGVAVATLVLTGCRGGGDDAEGAGPGITSEPCPEAVNEDNGCIYLGAISDLTKGPFAPLAGPITDAQEDGAWEDAFEATLGKSDVETPEPPQMDSCCGEATSSS